MTYVATIETIDEYLTLVRQFRAGGDRAWFRGQIDSAWKLEPSIKRNSGWFDNEADLVKRFKQLTTPRLNRAPDNEWAWVCLAQHFKLPTCLLDWSENPLVGLFFAVEKDGNGSVECDGTVFALYPDKLNRASYGSDTGILLLGHDEVALSDYLPGTQSGKKGPLAVLAPQSFDRLVAQSGVFTVSHRADSDDISVAHSGLVDRWTIPLSAKQKLRDDLEMLGINDASVYPDLDHIGDRIKTQYKK